MYPNRSKLWKTHSKPAQMTEESAKYASKIVFFGIFLIISGLPLLIIGCISTAEDRLGMIIPGAILMCVGGFTLYMSVAAVIRTGSRKSGNWYGTGVSSKISRLFAKF